MPLLELRDLLAFPGGDNETDTLINGVHLNRTVLDQWHYAVYTNNTISNESNCYLIFGEFQPLVLANGSWVNGTTCFRPYYGIALRGKLDVAFAVCFSVSVMFTLICLRKHGRQFLREDKRFRLVGRRWQWYWMLFVAACGMISTITGVDVDRYYLPSLPIILQSFFFTLMVPGALGIVWEAVRHWGSWQERLIVDADPFTLPQDDKRAKTEFWLPLVFYLFAWLNVFMAIPRSWAKLERQRSPEQQAAIAEPNGTDTRLKIASIMAFIAFLVILFSLHHSITHYKTRSKTRLAGLGGLFRHTPWKLAIGLVILAVRLAYGALAAWDWNMSIFKIGVEPYPPFLLGYGSLFFLIVNFIVWGYIDENDDKIIIERRRIRGRAANEELGITQKPGWWRKMNGDKAYMTDEERLRALTTEVSGTSRPPKPIPKHSAYSSTPQRNSVARSTRRTSSIVGLELSHLPPSHLMSSPDRPRPATSNSHDPFRDPSPVTTPLTPGSLPPPYSPTYQYGLSGSDRSSVTSGETGLTGDTLSGNPKKQQRVRSMLDP